jgi:pimeloyl-ACP methyl ester carboxylesterase
VLLIIIAVIVLLIVLDGAFVSWWYALDDRATPLEVTTPDGWTLVAWHRKAVKRRFETPVVLCHGLGNNHLIMEFRREQSLARYLAAMGFEVYSVDLRGAGGSKPPHEGPYDSSIDDHARIDVPTLVDAICAHAEVSQVAWVGHSLGGVCGLIAATSTELKERFAAIVTIGTPVFFKVPKEARLLIKLARWISVWGQFDTNVMRYLAPFGGRFSAPEITQRTINLRNMDGLQVRYLMANVFAPLWRGVLAQLDDWIEHDAFRSEDRALDYRKELSTLKQPMLVIGGTVDQLAPPDVTRQYYELLTAPERQMVIFGQSYGHSSEYGHGDLMVGKNVQNEVYPAVGDFLSRALKPTPES